MKILVINAECLSLNISENLCHLAYIRGLRKAGHEVSVLSNSGRSYLMDPSMKMPEGVIQYTYSGVSFSQRLSPIKKRIKGFLRRHKNKATEKKSSFMHVKKEVRYGLYGPREVYRKFVKKASRFRSDTYYDFVLSLSNPPASHLLAHELIKAGNVKCRHWIQIWEDPMSAWLDAEIIDPTVMKEEEQLLCLAEIVCYVTPLTLKRQKELFPEFALKMHWRPLPFYYEADKTIDTNEGNLYGYFGNYFPEIRNLSPFYHAAVKENIRVSICGNPDDIFVKTEKIEIFPRLPLGELMPVEKKANVLVFVCNKSGGQIPGKIYQYSSTDKIILFILDGTADEQKEIYKYFSQFKRYIFCENTEESITEAIRKIETGVLDGINNRPVEAFRPDRVVESILNISNEG